jgi:two-component system repressor protein LuxO
MDGAPTSQPGVPAGCSFRGFVGSSEPMRQVYTRIRSVAPSRATVFITGESGTGKELAAEAVHALSPRAKGPFIAINCGAIPRDLMDSEIFGHLKGSFTGAISSRDGAAKLAHRGTLFLDEVCEMDFALQTKLLRFLQTGVIRRIGATATETVDVRVVCATNKSPAEEVRSGRFREDLFYRLHVLPLDLPPLRQRGEDILPIARHFLALYAEEEGKRFRQFSEAAETALLGYGWPGNVRELQNAVRQAVVLNDGEILEADMLPALGVAAPEFVAERDGAWLPDDRLAGPFAGELWRIEKHAIESAIAACRGSIPQAARLLGVSPSTIYRKREAWQSMADAAPRPAGGARA